MGNVAMDGEQEQSADKGRSKGRVPSGVNHKSIKTRNEKRQGRLMNEAGQRTKAQLQKMFVDDDENRDPNELS